MQIQIYNMINESINLQDEYKSKVIQTLLL